MADKDWTSCDKLLGDGLADLGLKLTAAQRGLLLQYLQEMQRWNRTHNLTAVRALDEMVVKHLLDSLSVLPHLQGSSVLDIGSGGGLPGIPLAIANPRLEMTLLESNGKKCAFLRHAVRALKLPNVKVVQTRLEEFESKEGFDNVIARAFAPIPEFSAQAARLVGSTGCLLAMLGRAPRAREILLPSGFTLRSLTPLEVPGLHAERHLAVIARGLL
ncbi:MAG: 16S rRNA (guanine(527)-N(7))-methyltransferase RsmG [Nevskiales bacterium]